MIYVSSLAFGKRTVKEISDLAIGQKLNLEFSSSLPYSSENEEVFFAHTGEKRIHNYFPAPEDPFVLNLASGNDEIRNRTIDHCMKAMDMTARAGTRYFSVHAGFCIDPQPGELGRPLNTSVDFDRTRHWKLFLSSVRLLLKRAVELDLELYIENNVLAGFNYTNNINALFCCDSMEMESLISQIGHPRLGILLDTAHLKVSANTLNFDLDQAVQTVMPYVKVIHHSDNDGLTDTNQPFDEAYWFLSHMSDFERVDHVIEVRNIDSATIKQMSDLLRINMSK
ncbi:MAG: TIM barrel protein [Bacteroidia bacterium]|nr:TIM barrel protein [Bacteroidia bacterium]